LANDGLFGIVWKTDRRLLVARGVAEIYSRVGRIREGRWLREEREIPVDARYWHGGGSAGRNQGSHELSAVQFSVIQSHSFSSRNANCGRRLVPTLSASRPVNSLEINHLTILFAHKTTNIMIELRKTEIARAIGKDLFDDPIFCNP
jgi:hypothetical protein